MEEAVESRRDACRGPSGRDIQMLDLRIRAFAVGIIGGTLSMSTAAVWGIVLVVGGGIDLLRAFHLVLKLIITRGDVAGLNLAAAELAGLFAFGRGLGDGASH